MLWKKCLLCALNYNVAIIARHYYDFNLIVMRFVYGTVNLPLWLRLPNENDVASLACLSACLHACSLIHSLKHSFVYSFGCSFIQSVNSPDRFARLQWTNVHSVLLARTYTTLQLTESFIGVFYLILVSLTFLSRTLSPHRTAVDGFSFFTRMYIQYQCNVRHQAN